MKLELTREKQQWQSNDLAVPFVFYLTEKKNCCSQKNVTYRLIAKVALVSFLSLI